MAAVVGVDEVCDRLTSGVDTISVIAGLLIVATMALCASPSDAAIAFLKLGDGTVDPAVFRALYMTMSLVSLVCLFVTIILGSLLKQALRVTARDADRWRVLLRRDWLPTLGNTIFTVGNVALAGLISLSMLPAFGVTFSVAFASIAIFVNGFCTHLFNLCLLLPIVHPVHGWRKHFPEEFDLSLAMERLEALAAIDERARSGAKGI
jgi:hypothetical protein